MSTTQTAPAIVRKSTAAALMGAPNAPEGVVDAVVNLTNIVDADGDRIVPGAFAKQISAGKMPKVAASHDWSTVVGRVTDLKELLPGDPSLPPNLLAANAGALVATLKFNLDTPAGRAEYSNVAGGYVDEFSIGFIPELTDFNEAAQCMDVKSVFPLIEVSTVLMGASRSQDGSLTTSPLAVKAVKIPAADQDDEAQRYTRSVARVKAALQVADDVRAGETEESDGLEAIKALLSQEIAEKGLDLDCASWLIGIGQDLKGAPAPAAEAAEAPEPAAETKEADTTPTPEAAPARPLFSLLEATLPEHMEAINRTDGDQLHVPAPDADSLLTRIGRPFFGRA